MTTSCVWHTLPQHTPLPSSCRSGYKEQDDLVVFDGADQSQYGYRHQQRATYRNTHQDRDMSEVGQCSRRYHQTNQKYTNHLCVCVCVCVCVWAWGDTGTCHLTQLFYFLFTHIVTSLIRYPSFSILQATKSWPGPGNKACTGTVTSLIPHPCNPFQHGLGMRLHYTYVIMSTTHHR